MSDGPRLAVLATQDFGVRFVEGLQAAGHRHLLVATYEDAHDRRYGWGSVAERCAALGVECVTAEGASLHDRLAEFAPSHLLAGFYARILPRRTLALAPAYNVHPGALPAYRGPFPTAWAILSGETSIGVTVHRMDAGIDTGPILAQEQHPIGADETGFALYRRSQHLAAELFLRTVPGILLGALAERPQRAVGSYFGALPARPTIDWTLPVARIVREVRVKAPPYLPLAIPLKNAMLYVKRASVGAHPGFVAQGPGRVLAVREGGFLVSAVDGVLSVDEYDAVGAPGFTAVRAGDRL